MLSLFENRNVQKPIDSTWVVRNHKSSTHGSHVPMWHCKLVDQSDNRNRLHVVVVCLSWPRIGTHTLSSSRVHIHAMCHAYLNLSCFRKKIIISFLPIQLIMNISLSTFRYTWFVSVYEKLGFLGCKSWVLWRKFQVACLISLFRWVFLWFLS